MPYQQPIAGLERFNVVGSRSSGVSLEENVLTVMPLADCGPPTQALGFSFSEDYSNVFNQVTDLKLIVRINLELQHTIYYNGIQAVNLVFADHFRCSSKHFP